MPAVSPGAGCFRGFLPVVIEGDQLSCFLIGKQLLSNSEEVLAVLPEPLNEAFLGPRSRVPRGRPPAATGKINVCEVITEQSET